jgi:Uri superfamily endonuclease
VARNSARPRTYQLAIETKRAMRIQVGRLGEFLFPAGHYVYTGSARRGLEARIRRHLSGDKRLHWHIDYLLAAPGVQITGVSTFDATECALNRRTPGEIVVEGFGSSDCASGCGSHLKLEERPAVRRRPGKT